MPVSKPGTLPRWSETGGGTQSNISPAPSSGRQDIGWLPDDEVLAQFDNWWKNLGYRWFAYLNDLENQALTIIGVWTIVGAWIFSTRPTFNDGILINAPTTTDRDGVQSTGNGIGAGGRFIGGSGDGTGVRAIGGGTNGTAVDASSTGTNPTIFADMQGGGSGSVAEFEAISGTGKALQVTGNATSPAATFTAGAGQNAAQLTGGAGIAAATMANGTAATGATRQNAASLTNGDLSLSGVANPNKDVALSNVLSPKSWTKAWALCTVAGGGGGGNFTVTFTEGLNITSIARQSATLFRVTFAAAFASANYIVKPWVRGVSTVNAVVSSGQTTTVVDIAIQTVSTGNSIDLDASASSFTVELMANGPQ